VALSADDQLECSCGLPPEAFSVSGSKKRSMGFSHHPYVAVSAGGAWMSECLGRQIVHHLNVDLQLGIDARFDVAQKRDKSHGRDAPFVRQDLADGGSSVIFVFPHSTMHALND
jgi:hypothetical protein